MKHANSQSSQTSHLFIYSLPLLFLTFHRIFSSRNFCLSLSLFILHHFCVYFCETVMSAPQSAFEPLFHFGNINISSERHQCPLQRARHKQSDIGYINVALNRDTSATSHTDRLETRSSFAAPLWYHFWSIRFFCVTNSFDSTVIRNKIGTEKKTNKK